MAFDIQIIHWPTVEAFIGYLQGVSRPAWCKGITNHNTYIPNEKQWVGLRSMLSMKATYMGKGWTAGPNLYLCATAPNPNDTGIWQMTPITHQGVHAGACNKDRLGVENVGDFDKAPPSSAQMALLLAVNRAILERWGMPPEAVNVHNECMTGRTCPGKYLTGTQIRDALNSSWPRTIPPVSLPTAPDVTPASTLLSPPRATPEQCIAYILSRPHGEYTSGDVGAIVRAYFAQCAGIDPLLAIAQMIHETGGLTSWFSQRPRRNSAGLGVTGRSASREMYAAYPERYPDASWTWGPDGRRVEGMSFASWASHAIPAHLGRLLAYATSKHTPEQERLVHFALGVRPLPAAYLGSAPVLSGLEGRWAVPGHGYSEAIARVAWQIQAVE